MKYALLFPLLFLISCHCKTEDELINITLPDCIQSIIIDPKASVGLKTVQAQKVNGNVHYWLNTDLTHVDGAEYIINNQCDTVCYFCGECQIPDCSKKYTSNWVLIWKN
ncbi:MAG TPA: hypothetical protein PK006_09825 [Saprospiraceae bacterium]|nr:hypothetical protein [Saprospiraceae bacterium]